MSELVRPTTPAAARMRLHRDRRRRGLRCLTIELRETEIDALIRIGLLEERSHDVVKPTYAAPTQTRTRLWRKANLSLSAPQISGGKELAEPETGRHFGRDSVFGATETRLRPI